MSSISERLLEGRIKKFLMKSFEMMGTYLKDVDPSWAARIENLTMKSMISALEGMNPDNPIKNAKLILQGLGFTPVEIRWHPDQGKGEIFLSISRIWKKPIESDQMLQSFVKGVCRGIGSLFFGPKTPIFARLVDDREIPPRFRALFEFRPATREEVEKEEQLISERNLPDMHVDISARAEKEESVVQGALLEIIAAVISIAISKTETLNAFLSTLEWFGQQQLPHEWHSLEALMKKYPEKVLLRIYKEAQIRQSVEEWGRMLGSELARRIQVAHANMSPSQLIQGISLLPPEKITSILVYEPTEYTHSLSIDNHQPICNFLVYLWEGYISAIIESTFQLKERSCGVNPTDACIYVFLRKSK